MFFGYNYQIIHHSKKELVYNTLRDALIEGSWLPGERRTISELSTFLNVSRTPVAEACSLLEKEGWLTIIPQVGVEANKLTGDEAIEVFKIRGALEGLAGSEAINNITDSDLEKLDSIVDHMQVACDASQLLKFRNINRTFHQLIYRASKMPKLIKVLDFYWDSGARYAFLFQYVPEVAKGANQLHKKIVRSLRSRDKKK